MYSIQDKRYFWGKGILNLIDWFTLGDNDFSNCVEGWLIKESCLAGNRDFPVLFPLVNPNNQSKQWKYFSEWYQIILGRMGNTFEMLKYFQHLSYETIVICDHYHHRCGRSDVVTDQRQREPTISWGQNTDVHFIIDFIIIIMCILHYLLSPSSNSLKPLYWF